MDGIGETTIFYLKIWSIIQLKHPFINGWPWGSRYPCRVGNLRRPFRILTMLMGNGTPIYGNFKYEALGYSQRGNMDDGRLTALGRNMQVVEM